MLLKILQPKYALVFLTFILLTSCSFNRLYYYPNTNEVPPSETAEDVYLEWSKTDTFHGLFYHAEAAETSIYFLHGNAGNLSGWRHLAEILWKDGYNVFIIDYPGFGNSDKTPRHKRVQQSAQKGLDYFIKRDEVKNTKKILFGMSLGGNLATKIGVENQGVLDAMILEGPFNSHRDVGLTRVPKALRPIAYFGVKNKIKGEKIIKEWYKPLLVVHSEEDQVCLYRMGKELYENASSIEKELWSIKGKHLRGFAEYRKEYLKKIRLLSESL
ncbi:MAG: lysophospholipase [Flavobacteriales bacterium]|nr:lysophospholipase [Flavobacteriales bacterium]